MEKFGAPNDFQSCTGGQADLSLGELRPLYSKLISSIQEKTPSPAPPFSNSGRLSSPPGPPPPPPPPPPPLPPSDDASFEDIVTDESLHAAFVLYSIATYCPVETLKVGQFLLQLISTQNLHTLLQTSVNTLQSGNIEEAANKQLLGKFYLVLQEMFNLQLGKVFLATLTPLQVHAFGTVSKHIFFFFR